MYQKVYVIVPKENYLISRIIIKIALRYRNNSLMRSKKVLG